jgi:hypothetical protein
LKVRPVNGPPNFYYDPFTGYIGGKTKADLARMNRRYVNEGATVWSIVYADRGSDSKASEGWYSFKCVCGHPAFVWLTLPKARAGFANCPACKKPNRV